MRKHIWELVASFGLTFLAAAIGSLSTMDAIPTWYAELNKTAITPPNWVFGPAWTTLYILMAVALFLVWKQGIAKKEVRTGIQLFLFQLTLNALWSVIFFGAHQILLAFVEIIVLLFFIIWTTASFYRVNKIAAYLMFPYIAWVSFASILNFVTWLANK